MPSSPTSRMACRGSTASWAMARSSSFSWRDADGSVAATRLPATSSIFYRRALIRALPDVVHMLIVEEREEPGAQIGVGLEQVLFRDCEHQRCLNQIIGVFQVSSERPSVSAQVWKIFLKVAQEICHRY